MQSVLNSYGKFSDHIKRDLIEGRLSESLIGNDLCLLIKQKIIGTPVSKRFVSGSQLVSPGL